MRRVPPAVAVDAAARVAADAPGRTVFLGVDGWGAAGKTTLAGRIAAAVADAVVVHVDDFAAPGLREWDYERMERDLLAPLRSGRSARYRVGRWDRPVGEDWRDVPTGVAVVVEGVSSTRREVRVPWAFTCWVDAPRSVRLERILSRDGADLLAVWLRDWMPAEDAYVARENPPARVDLVVNGVIDEVEIRPIRAAATGGRSVEQPAEVLVAWLAQRPVGAVAVHSTAGPSDPVLAPDLADGYGLAGALTDAAHRLRDAATVRGPDRGGRLPGRSG